MKLSKSKLALAKLINENGGWPEWAEWSCQINWNDPKVVFSRKTKKPYRRNGWGGWAADSGILEGGFLTDKKINNWHQCVLSREEYYQAYPKADADGWIEWKGGECPVGKNVTGDIKLACGEKFDTTDMAMWNWHLGNDNPRSIIAYRLHKPEVKPEFCESVMRSIPEPSSKPTIEQLAQDYRNKLDFAKRKQQEADDAKAASDAALGELERAGEALGLLIGIAKSDQEPELVITDWRDLLVNDVIFVGEYDEHESGEYVVIELEDRDYGGGYAVKAAGIDGNGMWIDTAREWRFIRRP